MHTVNEARTRNAFKSIAAIGLADPLIWSLPWDEPTTTHSNTGTHMEVHEADDSETSLSVTDQQD